MADSNLCVIDGYGVAAFYPAVFILVRHPDGERCTFIEDDSRVHLAGTESDVHGLAYELEGDVKGDFIDGNGRIFPHFP